MESKRNDSESCELYTATHYNGGRDMKEEWVANILETIATFFIYFLLLLPFFLLFLLCISFL